MDALDFLMGMVKRDPNTLRTAGVDPQAAGQALDLAGRALGAAYPHLGAMRLGAEVGPHMMEGAAAVGETAMGGAFPRGFAQENPLPRDAGDFGLPPSVSQQVAAEGAFDPLGGIGRAMGWAANPTPYVGPAADFTRNPTDDLLGRLGYAVERTRAAEHLNPEAFAGQKGLGELAGNPLSYVGFGLPGRGAAAITGTGIKSDLLRQILTGAQETENLWNQVPGEVLGTAWRGAQNAPFGIGTALQQSKRAAAGIGEDKIRGIIGNLGQGMSQFEEMAGLSPWRAAASLKGVVKEGQQTAEEAAAGLAASTVDKATLRHWGNQATQDKELGRILVRQTGQMTPSVTEPLDLIATRSALEAKAGITAADTDSLLQSALSRLNTLEGKQPGWETSADIRKLIQTVQLEQPGVSGLRQSQYDLPMRAAEAAWLAERYGDVLPATVGRGAVNNEAAVLARANKSGAGGGGVAGPGPSTPPAAEPPAPSPPPSGAPSTMGLTEGFQSMGAGTVDQMYAMLWQKVLAGETTEAGAPSAVLQAAKMLRDAGRLNTREDLQALAQQVGPLERGPGFQQNMQRIVQDFQPAAPTAPGDPVPPGAAPPFTPTGPTPESAPLSGVGAPSVAPEALPATTPVPLEVLAAGQAPRGPGFSMPGYTEPESSMAAFRAGPHTPETTVPEPTGGPTPLLAPSLPEQQTRITQSLLNMNPGDPEFTARLVQQAPALVARYDTQKAATTDLLAQTGARDLKALLKHEDPAVVDQAKAILNDMGGADPSLLPETEVLSHAWMRDYMRELKIPVSDPTFLQKAAGEVMQVWRQQALFAPAFFVRNAVDGATRMLLYSGKLGIEHGVNPFGAGGRFGILGGAADENSFWQAWSRAFTRAGQQIPDSRHFQASVSRFKQDLYGVGPSPSTVGGMEGTELQARRGLERLPDIPLPWGKQIPLGRTVRTFRELYTAQEQAMREAGYWHAFEDAIPQALPKLTASLTEALGDNGRPVLQTVQDANGRLNARRFSEALSGANVSPEAKKAAETAFGEYQRTLDAAGTGFANRLFVNYKDTTNADEFLRNFLGFHVFATRSIPFYLETLATHPGLLRGVQMFQQAEKEKGTIRGTIKNKRLQYGIDLPAEDFVSALFGQNGMAMVDPTGYVSMVQAPLQAADENPQEARGTNLLGSVLNQLNRVGVGVAPWIQVPAQILGAYGGQQPANLLRVEPLVESALQWGTGQTVEAPWNALQRQRIGPFADRAPNDPAMTVRLKLREMALEQDADYANAHPMDPISPRFRQAMIAGNKDPLWQEAASLVGRQQFLQGASTFVSGAPLTFRSGTAQATDAIQAGLPDVNAEGGSKPLEPVIPRAGVAPGTPLETYALRERRLANLAASGHPEAAGMSQAFQRNLGEPGGSLQPSQISAMRHAVQQAYPHADPARKAAMLADPSMRPYILELKADEARRAISSRPLGR